MVAVSIGIDGVEFDPLVNIRVHPAAELFPLMQGEQFAELVNDIRDHGVRDPIVFTPDGQLLDGRNRYRACKKLGDEPERRTEHSEPWAFVISTNMRRRHLSDSQRKMIGARIAERAHGQHRHPDGLVPGYPGTTQLPPTQKQAAELLNVSLDGIERARKVVTQGIKPLQHAVDEEKITVSTASRIAELPPEEQEAQVRRINAGEKASQVSPPRQKKKTPRSPEDVERRATTYYSRSEVLSLDSLIKISSTLSGIATGLKGLKSLSPDLATEEARSYAREIRKALAAQRELIRILEQHEEQAA